MRILVYLLSLLMVFAPTYSAYASGISKGQIVKMGKQGGALVKTGAGVAVKVGKVGRALTPVGVMLWCASNKKKCKDYAGDAVEIVCDITGNCDVEHTHGPVCVRIKDSPFPYAPQYSTLDAYMSHQSATVSKERPTHKIINFSQDDINYINKTLSELEINTAFRNDLNLNMIDDRHVKYTLTFDLRISKIECDNGDKKLTNDELQALAKKIADQMDDDDIINYYNTDYDDVTINNYHYYGDEINRETNIDKHCESNSCHEISKEIEKDINEKKYDIDDVNEKNCTIEESTGKYIACNMTIKNDEENETPPKEDTDIPKKEDDDDLLTCDSSKFHKKICDWMDWTQDDLEVPNEDKPKIKDLSDDLELDKNRVNFGRACPVGDNLALSLHGVSISHQISYQGLCDAFNKMRPFIIGIGGIISVMIIGGRRV